jgi:hypothetical protein
MYFQRKKLTFYQNVNNIQPVLEYPPAIASQELNEYLAGICARILGRQKGEPCEGLWS